MTKNSITGLIIIAVSVCIPAMWFFPLAGKHDFGAAFSQYLGSVALVVMAISMIISTRLPGTALLFGPLDQAYVLHKWLGVGAMVAILLHDTIDADIDGVGTETLLTDIGETLGELSLYGLLALVLLSVATFTPYKLWKWTHRFMGAFFVAGALHYLLILKPFDLIDAPGLYVSAFCIAGILAYVYATINGLFSRGKRFTVLSAQPSGDALAVTLSPVGRKMKLRPGQFAFLSIDQNPEAHPFTISKSSDNGDIRFTIKALGDYTHALQGQIKEGMKVRVKGPYGGFTRKKGTPEIWVAAGVGITPFVSWANQLTANEPPVHLFYSVRQRSDASHLDELEAISNATSLQLHLIETRTSGRLTLEKIRAVIKEDLTKASVSFCGPIEMRDSLKKAFNAAGLPLSQFHYELFELRSGVGFRKMVGWTLKRVDEYREKKAA